MDDDIADIDQHPVAMRQAFNAHRAKPGLFEVSCQMIGDGADVAVRTAGGHDHIIAKRRFSRNVDADGVLGLGIVQARQDCLEALPARLTSANRSRMRCAQGSALVSLGRVQDNVPLWSHPYFSGTMPPHHTHKNGLIKVSRRFLAKIGHFCAERAGRNVVEAALVRGAVRWIQAGAR